MKKYIIILVLFTCYLPSKAQWVATVAGVLETPGFNDGPAMSARFFNPHGIAVDGQGNVYVADRYNHTVRVLDTNTGAVTTLAGQAGESGSVDGMGQGARFHEPWGLCATPDGVVYVADTKNNKIRKVLPDGTVSTVAGTGNYGTSNGPAFVATFGNPTGIEVDSTGNIYVADHLTHIIRKISNTGVVSTLAGTPYIPGDLDGTGNGAQFWRPYGLTLDSAGNIIVADEWNHKIRKVTAQGEVTTIAGNGQVGLLDGNAANAPFNYPWDVTVDAAGNVYVADGYNYVIRKIATDGSVTSLAGTPQVSGGVDGEGINASFSGATAIAWSQNSGSLFVGDAYNHMVREITLADAPAAGLSLLNLNGNSSLCEDDPLSLQASPGFYDNYLFSLDGNPIQNENTPFLTLTNLSPGEHTLRVEAGFQGEVLISNTITVTVVALPQPAISAVGPLSFYEGDSVVLVASGSGTFLWSTGATTQTITVYESGTYYVESTLLGCTGSSNTVTVDVTLLPDDVGIFLEGNSTLCPGEQTRLVSSSNTGNQWLKDGWVIPGETAPHIEVSESGIYQVRVTDPVTGITSLSNELEIVAAPFSDFDFEATPRSGEPGLKVDFRSTGADQPISYHWDFGDSSAGADNQSVLTNPSHRYENEGSFSIQLITADQYGCIDTLRKDNYIQIGLATPVSEGLFLPNAFTPNGDGENDFFRIRGFTGGEFHMAVFNQWGELLYQSYDPSSGWDGNRNGLPVHTGTYVYLVRAASSQGTKQLSGHVTLLR